jgi:hypothetical protein
MDEVGAEVDVQARVGSKGEGEPARELAEEDAEI